MTYAADTSHDFTPSERGLSSRNSFVLVVAAAVALAFGGWVHARLPGPHPAVLSGANESPTAATPAVLPLQPVEPTPEKALPDLTVWFGPAPVSLAWTAPLGPNFERSEPAPPVTIAEPDGVVPAPLPVVPQIAETVPVPAPRPPEVRQASRGPLQRPGHRVAQPIRTAAVPTAEPAQPGFFERLFGIRPPSGPVLAYASPDAGLLGGGRRPASGTVPGYDRRTAVYDIAAHTVYMPDGTRLEAHSGLGDKLDDPRFVHVRNRGATPPHVYDLTPREQLFHGVQALRMNPVGGDGVFGRTGLLAHTYMLGPNGDSNGCVSFRNYDAFLRAFSNGEVKRLAVVARLN